MNHHIKDFFIIENLMIDRKLFLTVVFTAILVFTTIVPNLVYGSGKYIRSLIVPLRVCTEHPPNVYRDTIEVDGQIFIGYIFSEKDSVYYIADENWEMRRLKGREIYTYPTPQEKIEELCKQ